MFTSRNDAPLLDVRIVRNANDPRQFVWRVLEHNGALLQSSTQTYLNDKRALRAANAAAMKIIRAGQKALLAWLVEQRSRTADLCPRAGVLPLDDVPMRLV